MTSTMQSLITQHRTCTVGSSLRHSWCAVRHAHNTNEACRSYDLRCSACHARRPHPNRRPPKRTSCSCMRRLPAVGPQRQVQRRLRHSPRSLCVPSAVSPACTPPDPVLVRWTPIGTSPGHTQPAARGACMATSSHSRMQRHRWRVRASHATAAAAAQTEVAADGDYVTVRHHRRREHTERSEARRRGAEAHEAALHEAHCRGGSDLMAACGCCIAVMWSSLFGDGPC